MGRNTTTGVLVPATTPTRQTGHHRRDHLNLATGCCIPSNGNRLPMVLTGAAWSGPGTGTVRTRALARPAGMSARTNQTYQ